MGQTSHLPLRRASGVAAARDNGDVEQPDVVAAYLKRLGVDIAGRPPGRALLAELQTAHLMTIPFENLDVFHRRGVSTDVATSVAKIVERGRGGWCYELNGAFGWLLGQLGFEFDYVSCRVADGTRWGPDRDHCAVIVRMGPDRLFVDVGFGDSAMLPIPLRVGEHLGVPRRMRIRTDVGGFVMSEFTLDEHWADKLRISIAPRALEDFTPRSDFLQSEEGNSWTSSPFATRASAADGSRITLRPEYFRLRVKGADHDDTPVAASDWSAMLAEHFGLTDTL
jgi:N-hydroxyarylamine O-acetyltransferase